jgi:hypothetical protein
MSEPVICPFCGYKSGHEYEIQLHIEEHHTESSPFTIREPVTTGPARGQRQEVVQPEKAELTESWTKCTRPSCGEYVNYAEIDEHLQMHDAIAAVEEDERNSSSSTTSRPRTEIDLSRHARELSANGSIRRNHAKAPASEVKGGSLLKYFSGSSSYGTPLRNLLKDFQPTGRLGKKELGPHAFEKSMPNDVRRCLETAAIPLHENRIGPDGRLIRYSHVANETCNLVPVLSDLSDLDLHVKTAYYCDSSVKHVHKLKCDGNFCGYWNIQMLVSYLIANESDPARRAMVMPNVLQIQRTIEDAWDAGTCSHGRVETGGIRNTRKWIGTHEAAAYFLHVGMDVTALSFKVSNNQDPPAYEQLLDYVEAYFISGQEQARRHGISYITQLPPIYFQRSGHSMTIVGFERRKDGGRNLIVFDPSFATTGGMQRLVDGRVAHVAVERLMAAYRKDEDKLAYWKEYEILMLVSSRLNNRTMHC